MFSGGIERDQWHGMCQKKVLFKLFFVGHFLRDLYHLHHMKQRV